MRNLYKRKPEFVIAERWTSKHKPEEIIVYGMEGFPSFWEDEFGHRYPMREEDGWLASTPSVGGVIFCDGSRVCKGDWVVTSKDHKTTAMKDEQFRSMYDAANFFERAHTCGQAEIEGDPGEA